MSTLPTMVITPSAASAAYAKVAGGGASPGGQSFGSMVQQAVEAAVQTSQTAETQSMKAIAGDGNLTDVVTALSRAELTLQTATAIRDRVVQAYQDVMRMPV
jgi:flagellar hook-basal body complex protein FliE